MISSVEGWEMVNLSGMPYPVCGHCHIPLSGKEVLINRTMIVCSYECAVKANALTALPPKQALALAIEIIDRDEVGDWDQPAKDKSVEDIKKIRTTYEAMP